MSDSDIEKNKSPAREYPDAVDDKGLPAVFSVHQLSFAYGSSKRQLDRVDFALFPTESVGLTGSNGAGKTTFFRCVTGLCKPQSGEIRLGPKIMRNEKDFFELRRMVGYALQNADDQLFFPTVLEDVAFGPLNLGLSSAEARDRARESLELVGLSGYEDCLGNQLSGGEKRLVALASILAMRPSALLLDEPLTGLDETASKRVTDIISRLDCAKIIISHDRTFLDALCTRKLVLQNGQLRNGDTVP